MVDKHNVVGSYFIDQWKQKISVSTDMEIEEEYPMENPTEFNTVNLGGGFASVSDNKLMVRYNNVHCSEHDVGVVQANHPAPVKRYLYYFEMSVVNAGAKGQITIGFTPRNFLMSRQPGWEVDSIGYHGNDGLLYICGQGKGRKFGPTYTSGDTVGGGINYSSNEFFFTKNGVFVGSVHNDVKSLSLFPTVAVHSLNEEVTVNFGQQPFVFDIQAFETLERSKEQMIIEKVSLHQDVSYGIVRSYLVHYGYADTLKLFDLASTSSLPPITSIQGNGSNERDNEYALHERKSLRQLIKNGDIDGAFQKLRDWYPNIVQDDSSACFLLCCQKFIELARVGKVMEAMAYGKIEFNRFFEMQSKFAIDFEDLIKDCIAVLAYNEPEKSSVGYLMKESQLELVADAINALILSTNPKVKDVKECLHSCLECLLKQLILCCKERMISNEYKGEPFNLSRFLDSFKKG